MMDETTFALKGVLMSKQPTVVAAATSIVQLGVGFFAILCEFGEYRRRKELERQKHQNNKLETEPKEQ